MIKQKPETILQGKIIETLESIGVWTVRLGRMKARPGFPAPECGEDGIPDLMVLLQNEVAFIEVKVPGKDLEPDQVDWHAKAKRFGVRAGVAHSVREAIELVNGWRKGRAA